MSFKGGTYRLAFSEGGLNGSTNYDLVPKTAFIYPSRNLNLANKGREKRGGSAKLNVTAITASPKCLGIGQYIPMSGSSVIFSAHSDGKIWKNETTAVVTGMSTTNRFDFTQGEDKMFICDGAHSPQVYTTAGTVAAINEPAADWTGSNQPLFMVPHGRGASRRMYAFGVPGFLTSFYASGNGTMEKFVTGVLKFTVELSDGAGIVGAIEANTGELVLFGKRQAYIFQDSDLSSANWGYYKAPWSGGVSHQKLLVKTDNDIYAMMDDGEIYSVSSAMQLNDYRLASITRPANIHTYIKNNIDLTKISEFHCQYERNEKCIYWWMVRQGQSTADVALKFYPDRLKYYSPNPESGQISPYAHTNTEDCWAIDDGTDNTLSGFKATTSGTMRNTDGSYSLITGDSVGFLWKLAQATKSDDGNGYSQVMRTAWLNLDLPRNRKRFVRAEIVYVVTGAYPVTINWFVDDAAQTSQSTNVAGAGSVFPLTFGTSTFASPGLNQVAVPLGAVGRRVQFEVVNSGAGQSVFLSQMNVDFVDQGPGYL